MRTCRGRHIAAAGIKEFVTGDFPSAHMACTITHNKYKPDIMDSDKKIYEPDNELRKIVENWPRNPKTGSLLPVRNLKTLEAWGGRASLKPPTSLEPFHSGQHR